MLNNQEYRAKLKHEAENILFNAEFSKELERQIQEKKRNAGKVLPEALKVEIAMLPETSLKRFKIENDD